MAHCPPEKLQDLEVIFEQLRQWPGLTEKKTGTFYYRGKGFLHFHIKGERRWADARSGKDWGSEIDCPFLDALAPDRRENVIQQLLQELQRRYQASYLFQLKK